MTPTDSKNPPHIGLFDSGRGGFSIWRELISELPHVQYSYHADLAHAPYGGKTDEQILERARALSRTLVERGAELIVVACNTATAIAIDQLRREFTIPFVGVEPYLTASSHLKLEGTGVVLVTPSMARSERFQKLRARRDPAQKILVHPCPTMAGLIEQAMDQTGEQQKRSLEQALEDLAPLKQSELSYALLGCTHYGLITELIEEYLNVTAISPAQAVARRVKELLGPLNTTHGLKLLYADGQSKSWREIGVEELALKL